jgi:uncharacterized protein
MATHVIHELQFNVAQLLKEPTGATRSYDINTKTITQLDEDVTLVSPLIGHVKFLRTGKDILVTGSLETTIQKSCGRCLATFTAPISLELEEEFYPTVDVVTGNFLPVDPDADEANQITSQHILDLSEVVRQDCLLAGDAILYCRPDCKGLCPHCGQDRNLEPCDCEDEPTDSRWAGLLALQLEE